MFEDPAVIRTIQYVWNHFYVVYTKEVKEANDMIQVARSQPSSAFQGLTHEGTNMSLLEMTLALLIHLMKSHFVWNRVVSDI